SELIQLAAWMQKRYMCNLQGALKSMIPSSQDLNKKYDKMVRLNISSQDLDAILLEKTEKFANRNRVLEILRNQGDLLEKDLLAQADISKAILKGIEKKGFIVISDLETYRTPFDLKKISRTENLKPNISQQNAIDVIEKAAGENKAEVFLLHGITGSGKTEVYMQIIESVIAEGKKAIVLIPEIALTPQTVNRFVGRFGGIVGVLHSKLSQGEKYDQWRKAKEGKISIMVGPRSAIFAPFENLGVIIIDEEHELTYKSEMPPKYHAREVAIKRASMAKCPVVLGSATPLVESYHKALEGKYHLLELKDKAITGSNLLVDIVDMRNELMQGNKTMLSTQLRNAMNEALSRQEQVILFLNRRGHSSFVSCRKCGYVVKCPSCDIPYTYHSNNESLICHYCGKSIRKVTTCPKCQSKYIKEFGVGTQKVENYIKSEFPLSKVLRMDFDTTSTKNGHENILNQFEARDADILIGTQMVAKGHHFENVTVVGVIAADLSLFVNDFRACERTFQLVTQVTGRTGRGVKRGNAIIQTYSPDHYSLLCAQEQDYEKFYENEIKFRKMMSYPPFSNIANILLRSEDEKQLVEGAHYCKSLLERIIGNRKVMILGPSPANISKLKNAYRWRIILKCEEYKLLSQVVQELNELINKDPLLVPLTVQLDINPMMSY
ncbi:MAG: primosomal protein N', partial [Vallitaleaceae bacterium]|nr:primosomal protein N' [Vallitaleaceae bacterium]